MFYPADESTLKNELHGFMKRECERLDAAVAISPHAGYIYSGPTAGKVFSSVNVPDRVIVLGPKHRHGGARAAVSDADVWCFPFGEVPVDRDLCEKLSEIEPLVFDDRAHRDEHSLEVQIPFIHAANPNVKIAPVALGHLTIDKLRAIGRKIGDLIAAANDPVMIVASTDMSHQIPIDRAAQLDRLAIDRVLNLDPEGLYSTVADHGITMCGVVPTFVALHAALQLGAKQAELIDYTTSADANGDTAKVVGYAGLTIR